MGAGFVHLATVARRPNMVGQNIRRAQQELQHILIRRDRAAAHQVERGFKHVAETDEGFEAKRSGSALDRVDRPKDGIDDLGVGIARLHGQKPALQLGELFLTLLKEGDLNGG